MSRSLIYFFNIQISEDDLDDCMVWALGKDYGALAIVNISDIWNERHGNIFKLYGDEFVEEAYTKMVRAYLEQKAREEI